MFAFLGFFIDTMSPSFISAYLGVVAVAMGTVMGVVQATVQSEVPRELLGTATATISVSRSLGGAVGTALAGALLFSIMAASGIEISTELQAILQGGGEGLANLGPDTMAGIRRGMAMAFRGVIFLIAGYAAISAVLAWTLPRRTL
jgi:hypothetical protein